MISSDQFLQCDVRLRQAKNDQEHRFGNLATNVCGDFLQLPPVEKHKGSRRSLAMPLDHFGRCEVEEAEGEKEGTQDKSLAARMAEARQVMRFDTEEGLLAYAKEAGWVVKDGRTQSRAEI